MRRFVDGSHEWGREGSSDCGSVATEESGISKLSRHSAKHGGSLCVVINDKSFIFLGLPKIGPNHYT